MTPSSPADRAARIHADLPVVDDHNDLPWKLRTTCGGDLVKCDPGGTLEGFHTDIPRMLEGGVGAQFWSAYVPCGVASPFARTIEQIDLIEQMAARDHRLAMAATAHATRTIRASGRIASIIGVEGGHAIEDSLANLDALADRGARYMTLTHSDNTSGADSATDVPEHGGLTDFGRRVIERMNRRGILVDVSHVAAATMRDALAASDAPIIASHSNAAALAPHPRNVPDDVLAEIGRRGGVVMAVFFPGFLVAETAQTMLDLFEQWRRIRSELDGDEAAIAAEIDRIESGLQVDRGAVADVADHVEHIAHVAGVDAVGIGSDFDGMTMTPDGLEDVSCYPALTEELLRRSWSEADIRKVLGDNSLRVLAAAEAIAR